MGRCECEDRRRRFYLIAGLASRLEAIAIGLELFAGLNKQVCVCVNERLSRADPFSVSTSTHSDWRH